MVIKSVILDIQGMEVLEMWVLLPIRQVALQVSGVLFKNYKLGIEIIEDVFGVKVSERRWVIFFVIVRRGHRSGTGRSESVGVFHGCVFLYCSRVVVSFLCETVFSFISGKVGDGDSESGGDDDDYESDFVWVPRSCLQWDIPSI